MFDKALSLHHYFFSFRTYWLARHSMRFNKELVQIANDFRRYYLNSTNEWDNIIYPDDWTQTIYKREKDRGGPYMCAHVRRTDFLFSFLDREVPSIKHTAHQIRKALKKYDLNTLFISTDASDKEIIKLKNYLPEYKVVKYNASEYVLEKFGDGGIAILDIIICSYARYFVGTDNSTFSYRIFEEREILGFERPMTFNRFCKDDDEECLQPAHGFMNIDFGQWEKPYGW